MLKKILSLMLVGVMILSLTACGGNSTSTSSNKKQTKSALKGDFIFYTKNDNGGTYFTNNDDIEETLLSDKNVSDICVDEKRKSIIYISDSKLYIKSLKQIDDMPIEISNTMSWREGGIYNRIWNNQIIFYNEYNNLFIYDLDSQKKERLTEFAQFVYGIVGDTLIYVEGETNSEYYNKIVSYSFKDKHKKEKDISSLMLKSLDFAGDVLYSYGYGSDDNTMILYKITVNDEPKIIDEMETKKLPKEKYNASELHYTHFITFTNGMIYYAKPTDYKISEISKHREMGDYIYCFYDGNELREFEKDVRVTRLDNLDANNTPLAVAEYKDNMSQGYPHNDFIINDNIYRNKELNGISDDGKQVVFTDQETNSLKVFNIQNNETSENTNKIWGNPIKFNNNNLLYAAVNRDLILNNNTIDYNIKLDYYNSIEENVKCNYDCSTIVYFTNTDTLNVYKDGKTKIIGSANNMYLTNNNNVYYHKDGNVYFYKNDESNLISENAYLLGYSILK